MAELVNGEFEFRGMRFGTDRSGYPLAPGGFTTSYPSIRSEDEDNSFGDGLMFGRDYYGGMIYAWDLVVYREGPGRWQAADRALAEFRHVWHGQDTRFEPGAVDRLVIWHGDEPGLVFGRARHFATERADLRKGVAGIICDFQAMDSMIYALNTDSRILTFDAAPVTGLSAPLIAPLTTTGTNPQSQAMSIDTMAPAPVRVTFRGPVTNPSVSLLEHWEVGLDMTIPDGQEVTVDAMMNTVMMGGGSVAGALTRKTPRLIDLKIPEGDHEISAWASASSGSATVLVEWYPAKYAV